MAADTEARLLWATDDEANTGKLVQSAAEDLGLQAVLCTPRELSQVLRPARFDLVGIELGVEARDGLALIRQVHDRFPRLAFVAGVPGSSVSALRASGNARAWTVTIAAKKAWGSMAGVATLGGSAALAAAEPSKAAINHPRSGRMKAHFIRRVTIASSCLQQRRVQRCAPRQATIARLPHAANG